MSSYPVVTPPAFPYAQTLLAQRHIQGISRQDLARRIGVKPGALEAWEHGVYYPVGRNLERWAEALGFEVVLWPRERTR